MSKFKEPKNPDSVNTPIAQIKQFQDNHGNTIAIEALIPLEKRIREGYWIFYSPHFRTYGHSRNSEEGALEDFRISLKTFFDIHRERGTVEKALFHFGWQKVNNIFSKPPKYFNTPEFVGKTRNFQVASALA